MIVNVTSQSHLDHAMSEAQRTFALDAIRRFRIDCVTLKVNAPGFVIAEVKLPEELGTVPCALLGPLTGEAPIAESDVFHAKRRARPNTSRLVRRPPTKSRTMTAVIVKNDLATIYGGPLAPQEPGDPYLAPENLPASIEFWKDHALSAEAFGL